MTLYGKAKQTVEDTGQKIQAATEVARESLTTSLLVASIAIVVAVVALVVAVIR